MTDYGSPVGTEKERASGQLWPGTWFDATGFKRRYRIGSPSEAYHTGADLNNNMVNGLPKWDADRLAPVYAASQGVVTCNQIFKDWGRIIVIYHDNELKPFYTRYAHVTSPIVRVGDRVACGQQLCLIGNAEGKQPYHLHFDVGGDILGTNPSHWPKLNLSQLIANYFDPLAFLRARIKQVSAQTRTVEVTANVLFVRISPDKQAAWIRKLKRYEQVRVLNVAPISADGYHWGQLISSDGVQLDEWIALDYTKAVD